MLIGDLAAGVVEICLASRRVGDAEQDWLCAGCLSWDFRGSTTASWATGHQRGCLFSFKTDLELAHSWSCVALATVLSCSRTSCPFPEKPESYSIMVRTAQLEKLLFACLAGPRGL